MKTRSRAVWCAIAASVSVPVASGNGGDLAGICPSMRVMRCPGDTDQDIAASANLSVAMVLATILQASAPALGRRDIQETLTRAMNAEPASHHQCISTQLAHSVSGALVARLRHRESVD